MRPTLVQQDNVPFQGPQMQRQIPNTRRNPFTFCTMHRSKLRVFPSSLPQYLTLLANIH